MAFYLAIFTSKLDSTLQAQASEESYIDTRIPTNTVEETGQGKIRLTTRGEDRFIWLRTVKTS